MKVAKKKSEPVKETQMVSLADIAFLIIFFFMLSSQFVREGNKLDLPQAPHLADTHSDISVALDSTGGITLNGDPIADSTILESRLRDLLAGKSKPEDCEVRLRCDKNLKYKTYRPVYESISNAGGIIAIMHDLPR